MSKTCQHCQEAEAEIAALEEQLAAEMDYNALEAARVDAAIAGELEALRKLQVQVTAAYREAELPRRIDEDGAAYGARVWTSIKRQIFEVEAALEAAERTQK